MTASVPDTSGWRVRGHDPAVTFLRRTMANRRTRHAYLITGTASIGKMTLAESFAATLNCEAADESLRPCWTCRSCRLLLSGNHPDVLYPELDKGRLRIDAARELMRLIALKPYSSRYRVAIFPHFDRSTGQAQDALLKTLEEPPSHAVLLLLAESVENILSTITSRCQMIPLRPVSQNIVKDVLLERGADEAQATLLSRLSSGRIGWALTALTHESVLPERDNFLNELVNAITGNRGVRFTMAEELERFDKESPEGLTYLLETWQMYWRDVLLQTLGNPVPVCNVDRADEIEQLASRITPEQARTALRATRDLMVQKQRTNASLRMGLEVMFLDYPGV